MTRDAMVDAQTLGELTIADIQCDYMSGAALGAGRR